MDSEIRHTTATPLGAGESVVRVPITHPDAQRLIEEIQAEYRVRYGGSDDTPYEDSEFGPPRGAFYVVYRDEVPVSMGAWRRRDDVVAGGTRNTAELKRMFVTPSVRRTGLARRLLAHLERTAAEAGVEVVILETGLPQPEAIALYEAAGYEPIPGFGLYRGDPENRCYAKLLTGLGSGPSLGEGQSAQAGSQPGTESAGRDAGPV